MNSSNFMFAENSNLSAWILLESRLESVSQRNIEINALRIP